MPFKLIQQGPGDESGMIVTDGKVVPINVFNDDIVESFTPQSLLAIVISVELHVGLNHTDRAVRAVRSIPALLGRIGHPARDILRYICERSNVVCIFRQPMLPDDVSSNSGVRRICYSPRWPK